MNCHILGLFLQKHLNHRRLENKGGDLDNKLVLMQRLQTIKECKSVISLQKLCSSGQVASPKVHSN